MFVAMIILTPKFYCCFFFNDTATTEIYTLSLHDALPICFSVAGAVSPVPIEGGLSEVRPGSASADNPHAEVRGRSEEHTSELQSRLHLVCRLLLEKKKKYR